LSGTGVLEIQRHASGGRADIVINQWFGTIGTVSMIYLGEGIR
jgi:hypothetical protein